MNLRLFTKNAFLFIKLIFLASIFITYSSCQKRIENESRILDKNYKNEIIEGRKVIRDFLVASFTPGLSISVSYNNKIVWSEGYGQASKELKVPASRKTKYRIGETSEMFTTFAIAKLQEEGKLNIDSSFYNYIPHFPKKRHEFTLKQLGVNSAGFLNDHHEILINPNKLKNLKEYIRFHKDDSLVYKPGTYSEKSVYSSALLGTVAEEITGKFYQVIVKDMILDTLKLNDTKIDNPFIIIDNRSDYYYHDYLARQINAPYVDLRFIAPVHGFISTADDLNRAAQTIMEPGFFKQETLDLFMTPYELEGGHKTNRGFGWWITKDPENTSYIQLGATTGGTSIIAVYPEEKLVITVCSNIQDKDFEFPARAIANIFFKKIKEK